MLRKIANVLGFPSFLLREQKLARLFFFPSLPSPPLTPNNFLALSAITMLHVVYSSLGSIHGDVK